MPSVSAKQHQFMQAVAHGWQPDREKSPGRAVAQDFVAADKKAGKFKPKAKRAAARVYPHLSPE